MKNKTKKSNQKGTKQKLIQNNKNNNNPKIKEVVKKNY